MRRGNYLYENASSTFREETDIAAAGDAGQETNVTGCEVGIPSLIGDDSLGLEGSNLTNFPIGYSEDELGPWLYHLARHGHGLEFDSAQQAG